MQGLATEPPHETAMTCSSPTCKNTLEKGMLGDLDLVPSPGFPYPKHCRTSELFSTSPSLSRIYVIMFKVTSIKFLSEDKVN